MDILKKLIELEDVLKSDMAHISNDRDLINESFQDAYLKIHNYVENGREFKDTNINSLLKFICKNILIDKLRILQRYKTYSIEDSLEFVDYSVPEEDIEVYDNDPFINKKLSNAFSNMSHDMYMTYKLRQKGVKFKDIAYLTDACVNTTLGRMRYARRRIENEFNKN